MGKEQTKFCKNHPTVEAHKSCYTCKSAICRSCQIHRFHHLFCSWRCILRYGVNSRLELSAIKKEYVIMFLVLLVLQLLIQYSISPGTPADQSETSAKTEHEEVFIPDTGYSVLNNRLTISGQARNPSIIGLEHNGRFVASTISDNSQYSFRDYRLAPGSNIFVVWGLGNNGKAVVIDSFSIVNTPARTSAAARSFERLITDKKILALTFDGGSEANGADSIIHILGEKGIPATFFLTGIFIQRFPNLITRLNQCGFEIANHSYDHPHLTTWSENYKHIRQPRVSPEFIAMQLHRTDSLFEEITGNKLSPYWRAPYGEYNQEIIDWAAQAGYRHIGWSQNCDSWDWVSDEESELYRSNSQLLEHFLELERSGSLKGAIILMHLNSNRVSDQPYKMLDKLIDSLTVKNYKFVKISRLISQSYFI